MKETRGKNTRSVKILILLSILLTLSGTAAIASADDAIPTVPNVFYGTVALNGEWAEVGTTIKDYVGNDPNPRGEFEVEIKGLYYISVEGSESDEEGETITFKVNGVLVDQTAVWHTSTTPLPSQPLNLIVGDPPTAPPPTPPSAGDRSNGGGGGSGSPAATPSGAGTPVSEAGATPTPALTLTPEAQTTPTPTEESRTEPKKVPGFEVISTLAGLFVVVYLVRRRRW